jgi:hypothetical protein
MTEYMEEVGIPGASGVNASNAGDVFAELQKFSGVQLAIVIVFYSMVFVITAAILGVFLYAFIKNTSKDAREIKKEKSGIKAVDVITFMPGILMVILIYICNGLMMAGTIDAETMRIILKAIGVG